MGKIGITIGDVAGIGPEIILKSLQNEVFRNKSIVYGSKDVLDFYNDKFNYGLEIVEISLDNQFVEGKVNVIDPVKIKIEDFEIGQLSAKCGDAAFQYLKAAIQDAKQKKIDSIVTAPLNKEALHMGGHLYAGHTEILADLTDTREYAMLLWSEKLKTIHVSTHCSLLKACEKVKKERVMLVIKLAAEALLKAGKTDYKIAVAGLNPHAGENGLFGGEEINEIIPAINKCKAEGITVDGPLPPDTVFLRCLKGEYDLVVAMYHDQGHIPLKLFAFDDGVNMTVGLPFIRTSVDHGTAFDIAGKNIANENSMIKAIEAAEVFAR